MGRLSCGSRAQGSLRDHQRARTLPDRGQIIDRQSGQASSGFSPNPVLLSALPATSSHPTLHITPPPSSPPPTHQSHDASILLTFAGSRRPCQYGGVCDSRGRRVQALSGQVGRQYVRAVSLIGGVVTFSRFAPS